MLSYLNEKYPAIGATRFTVKGYGKDKPLVPNTSDETRALNRRVEFTVLNKEVLQKEVERRRLLKQGGDRRQGPARFVGGGGVSVFAGHGSGF